MPETTSKDWDAFNIEKTALKKGSERIQPQARHARMKSKKRKSGPIVLRAPKRKIYINSCDSLAKELKEDVVKCIRELVRAEGVELDSDHARIPLKVVHKVRQRIKSLLKPPAR
jgi:hypothetical protein